MARTTDPDDLARFMTGVGSWFGAFGLHNVLFSTLLVVELHETEVRVGAAQSAIMVPAVVLMLFGGSVADHVNRKRLLIGLHTAACILALALAGVLGLGGLSYSTLLAYAVLMGTLQAFLSPARDAALSDVVQGGLAHAVARMNLTQWGCQALGALLAAGSVWTGAAPLLVLQGCVLAGGAAAFARLRTAAPSQHTAGSDRPPLAWSQLGNGLLEVVRTPDLLMSWILVCGVGVLFMGPFMVVLPLLVRDVYSGGGPQIALVNTAFPLGTITGSLALMARGGLLNEFRAQRIALVTASATLIVLSLGFPFWGVLAGVYAWGISAAVFIIASRTLFQELASPVNRGRVLAAYSMGFLGAAGLLGAPLSGFLAAKVGPNSALAVLGISMLILVGGVSIVTWRRSEAIRQARHRTRTA